MSIYSNKRYYIEFAKIYRRLMEVELQLRERIIISFTTVYKNKSFFQLNAYLKTIKNKKTYKYIRVDGISGNILDDIINNVGYSDSKKLIECVHKLYLTDLLGILDYKIYYKNKLLIKLLYHQKPSHNDIKKFASGLKKLRNCVMHFNFQRYLNDRKKYIEALVFFENHFDCFMRPVNNLPLVQKISTKNIVKFLHDNYSDIFDKNDRLFCDVFDDIAILNGKPADTLPQYWTILRIRYDILREEGKVKPKDTLKKREQLALSFESD